MTVQRKRHCSPRIYIKILIGNIFIMKQLASHSVQGKIIKHDGLLLYLKSSPKGLASSCSVSSLAEAARRRRGRSEARTASRHALGSPTSRSLSADKETLFLTIILCPENLMIFFIVVPFNFFNSAGLGFRHGKKFFYPCWTIFFSSAGLGVNQCRTMFLTV